MYIATVDAMDDKEAIRKLIARYIEAVVAKDADGKPVSHAAIAKKVNEEVRTVQFAGPLVGRWRRAEVEISDGNLAAFARAYGRNPVEAFVIADRLTSDEAEGALDDKAVSMLVDLGIEVSHVATPETSTKESRTGSRPRKTR